jgi:hypothetical protein
MIYESQDLCEINMCYMVPPKANVVQITLSLFLFLSMIFNFIFIMNPSIFA